MPAGDKTGRAIAGKTAMATHWVDLPFRHFLPAVTLGSNSLPYARHHAFKGRRFRQVTTKAQRLRLALPVTGIHARIM